MLIVICVIHVSVCIVVSLCNTLLIVTNSPNKTNIIYIFNIIFCVHLILRIVHWLLFVCDLIKYMFSERQIMFLCCISLLIRTFLIHYFDIVVLFGYYVCIFWHLYNIGRWYMCNICWSTYYWKLFTRISTWQFGLVFINGSTGNNCIINDGNSVIDNHVISIC